MAGAGAKAGGELPLGWSSEAAGGRPSPGGCDCAGGGVVDFFSSALPGSDASRFVLLSDRGGLSIGAGAGLTAVLPSIGSYPNHSYRWRGGRIGDTAELRSVQQSAQVYENVALKKQRQTSPGTPCDPC